MAVYSVRHNLRGKSRRRRTWRRTAVVALLLVAAAGACWVAFARSSPTYTLATLSDSASSVEITTQDLAMFTGPQPPDARAERVIYPYSVVPGGVRTAQELHEKSAHDRVVASHYAGFDFRKARVVELRNARQVYLSYRIKDQIFWTKKKVSLRKGERLITDGKITARTRCANRVSESAEKAVSPEEPPPATFDKPVVQTHLPETFESALQTRPAPPGFGAVGPPVFGFGGGGGRIPPIIVPPTPSGECDPEKEKCGPTTPVPPTPVPEPGSILLVSSGLAGIYLRYRKSKVGE